MNNKHFLGAGINKYVEETELNGCENDINDWYNLLSTQEFGFKKTQDHIIDKEATYYNITYGFTNLLQKIKNVGTIGVFIFSGHGTQFKGEIGEGRNDHLEEGIITIDENVISDNEFRKIINENPFKGTLICVFDSCFSGTITDLDQKDVKNKDIERTKFFGLKTSKKNFKKERSNGFKIKRIFQTKNPNEILLTATSEVLNAYEYNFSYSLKKRWNGIFTRFSIDTIDESILQNKQLTYEELFNEINKKLQNKCKLDTSTKKWCKQEPYFYPQKGFNKIKIFT